MKKLKTILNTVFLICFGLALHDYAHQVYQLKGYHNLIEGGYIGFIGMILSYLIKFFIRRKSKKGSCQKSIIWKYDTT